MAAKTQPQKGHRGSLAKMRDSAPHRQITPAKHEPTHHSSGPKARKQPEYEEPVLNPVDDTDEPALRRKPDAPTARKGQVGAFVSGGYKFGKLPSFVLFGKTKMSHIMQGTYVKPILYLGHYKENQVIEKGNSTYEVGKQNVTFGALQIEIGKQWIFGDKVVLDFYYGLGYGIDNKEDVYQPFNPGYYYYDDATSFNYANARLGKSPGLSATFGLKLGLLLK